MLIIFHQQIIPKIITPKSLIESQNENIKKINSDFCFENDSCLITIL